MHDELLFSVLADVVNGYSFCKIDGKDAYIKHLDLSSELKSSSVYKKFFDEYKRRTVPTNAERLAFLKEEGDWTEADDSFISKNRKYLENLRNTRDKLFLKSQLAELDKTIAETAQKLEEKASRRERLIGPTCEKYAGKKKEESQILGAVFKDEEFKVPFLTEEEIEYADNSELQKIFDAYFQVFKEFTDDVLKKIAVAPIFYNFFSLTPKESPAEAFEAPILKLTFFQQKLLHYAQNIRYVYENTQNIPNEIKDNYDSMLEFARREKVSSKREMGNAGYSIVGATKDDMKMAGIDMKNSVSPFELLKKSGKTSLDKKDFMNSV